MFLPPGQRPTSTSYDTIVIGSGPAGLAVALRLAEAGKRILVLESDHGDGDILPSIGYGHFAGDYWNAHARRGLGGTSSVWTGRVDPLHAADFDQATLGVSWPITFDELLPYYQRAAPILDRHPTVAEAHDESIGHGWFHRPSSTGAPTRFGEKYRDLLERSSHVDVALGHTVVHLDANAARTAVTALHCFDHAAGVQVALTVAPAQSVVAACGGLGNAHLLLQSRPDGAPPVGNESGLAGKFLMEHVHVLGAGTCLMADGLDRFEPSESFGPAVHTLAPARETTRTHGRAACSLDCWDHAADDALVGRLADPGTTFHHYRIDIRAEMRPSAANHVFLLGERGRSGAWRTAARCALQADDLMDAEQTLRMLGESLLEGGQGRVRIHNEAIYEAVTGGGHIMGTTRMGRSRADSVVDRRCMVHDYDNFFITGSSVFATGGTAHPTFTVVALALRVADEVLQRG